MNEYNIKLQFYNRNIYYITPNTPNTLVILNQFLPYEYTSIKVDYKKKRKGITEYVRTQYEGNYYEIINEGKWIKISHGFLKYIPEDIYEIIDDKNLLHEYPTIVKSRVKTCLPNYELRDDQVDAVIKCFKSGKGIVQAPTGSGKSIIITAILKILLPDGGGR